MTLLELSSQTQTIEMAFALDTLKGRRNWALATVGSVGGLIFAIKARKGVQAVSDTVIRPPPSPCRHPLKIVCKALIFKAQVWFVYHFVSGMKRKTHHR